MDRFTRKKIVLNVFIQVLILLVVHTVFAVNPVIHIKLASTTYSDETIIRYNPASTTSFDFQFDANKIMSTGTTPSMYSIIGTKKYAINTLPNPDSLLIIQLGSNILQNGTYTMSFVNSTGMYGYSLYDKFLDSEIKIDSSSLYSFTGTVGDVQTRFELHYNNSESYQGFALSTITKNNSNVIVGSCSGGMSLTFKNTTPENYVVKVIGQGGRVLKIVKSQNAVSNYSVFFP